MNHPISPTIDVTQPYTRHNRPAHVRDDFWSPDVPAYVNLKWNSVANVELLLKRRAEIEEWDAHNKDFNPSMRERLGMDGDYAVQLAVIDLFLSYVHVPHPEQPPSLHSKRGKDIERLVAAFPFLWMNRKECIDVFQTAHPEYRPQMRGGWTKEKANV